MSKPDDPLDFELPAPLTPELAGDLSEDELEVFAMTEAMLRMALIERARRPSSNELIRKLMPMDPLPPPNPFWFKRSDDV